MPEAKRTTMKFDVRPGESLSIGGLIDVEVMPKSGNLARLRVTAPQEVPIQKISGHAHEVAPSMPIFRPS